MPVTVNDYYTIEVYGPKGWEIVCTVHREQDNPWNAIILAFERYDNGTHQMRITTLAV